MWLRGRARSLGHRPDQIAKTGEAQARRVRRVGGELIVDVRVAQREEAAVGLGCRRALKALLGSPEVVVNRRQEAVGGSFVEEDLDGLAPALETPFELVVRLPVGAVGQVGTRGGEAGQPGVGELARLQQRAERLLGVALLERHLAVDQLGVRLRVGLEPLPELLRQAQRARLLASTIARISRRSVAVSLLRAISAPLRTSTVRRTTSYRPPGERIAPAIPVAVARS